jgi:hypothetical protein
LSATVAAGSTAGGGTAGDGRDSITLNGEGGPGNKE